jgi:hypothetical protein
MRRTTVNAPMTTTEPPLTITISKVQRLCDVGGAPGVDDDEKDAEEHDEGRQAGDDAPGAVLRPDVPQRHDNPRQDKHEQAERERVEEPVGHTGQSTPLPSRCNHFDAVRPAAARGHSSRRPLTRINLRSAHIKSITSTHHRTTPLSYGTAKERAC